MPTTLSQKRIHFLWTRIVEHSGIITSEENLSQFNLLLDFYQKHEIMDYLPLAGISGKNYKAKENMDDWKRFSNIAEKCFEKGEQVIVFSEEKTKKAFEAEIERHKHSSSAYVSSSNLSLVGKLQIQELGIREWLTDLDISNWLTLAGVGNQVIISPFETTSLGAALSFRLRPLNEAIKQYEVAVKEFEEGSEEHEAATKQYLEATEPFELYALVSKVKGITQEGTHWFALKLKISPRDKSVIYKVDDSMPAYPVLYKNIIENALKFQDVEAKQVTLSDDYSISGELNDTQVQFDAYSCGYRALLCVLKYFENNNHPLIQEYIQTPETSKELVKVFYKGLLEQEPGWEAFKNRFDERLSPLVSRNFFSEQSTLRNSFQNRELTSFNAYSDSFSSETPSVDPLPETQFTETEKLEEEHQPIWSLEAVTTMFAIMVFIAFMNAILDNEQNVYNTQCYLP